MEIHVGPYLNQQKEIVVVVVMVEVGLVMVFIMEDIQEIHVPVIVMAEQWLDIKLMVKQKED